MAAETDHILTTSTGLRTKYTFIVINFIFFITSFAILGVGIWVLLEHNVVSVVFEIVGQQDKMRAPIYLVTLGAAAVTVIAYVGGYGAYKESKYLIVGYLIGAVIVFIMALLGAILALVYQSQVDDRVRSIMRDTIVKEYGRDTFITNTWDYAQVKLYCCGVEDASWSVYKSSDWYHNRREVIEKRVLVPPSCCVQDQYGHIFNLEQCQLNFAGPPRLTAGENSALRHRGCFSVAQERTYMYVLAISVTGFMLAIFMILGMVVDIILITLIQRSKES